MSESAFLQQADFYRRDINPIKHYVEHSSFFLSKMTGDPIEKCREFVAKSIGDKNIHPNFQDPTIHYFERDDNFDRHQKVGRLSQYLREVIQSGYILAPTGTAYLKPAEQASFLTEFVINNKKRRSVAKKQAFIAKTEGNIDLYIQKNNTQNNMKLYNNSLSGTFGASSSVLFNPTGHNTLTSTIRCVSSFGNSSNERVVAGNRHFWSKDVLLNNIITVACDTNAGSFKAMMDKYGLHYPTVQETMECITYSSDLYWRDTKSLHEVFQLVEKLSDVERAAFVYNGDLYHLKKHNDAFVRKMLGEMGRKVVGHVNDALGLIDKIPEEIVNFTHQICYKEVEGKGKRYDEIDRDGNLGTLVLTAQNVQNTIMVYRDLFREVFLTNNISASTAYIPNMVRRTVVLSDTDSTMFSVGDYVEWYFGKVDFSPESYGLAGAVVFIATQTVAHSLAILSSNINVDRDKLHVLAMKPEYTFPVFALTSVAKHYYTGKTIQEGNVFKYMDLEIKGVHLKNSSSPPTIVKRAKETMQGILEAVMAGKQLGMFEYLTSFADIEREIVASLLNGEPTYYRQSKIKEPAAYTKDVGQSPYLHHLFWEQVMQPKYGAIAAPPYSTIKIPTKLDTPTATAQWLGSLTDREFADRMKRWMVKYNKTTLPTIYLSTAYVQSFGIPVELKSTIDTKRIVLDLMNVFRIISETLGFFLKPNTTFMDLGY